MKKFLVAIGLAVALFAASMQDLREYLVQKSVFDVAGEFYMYDFEGDGKIDLNDWMFVATNGQAFRLLGKTPTPDDVFGWQKLPYRPAVQGEPNGYFVYIGMPGDDSRFSWIYVTNRQVYKLAGANADHSLRYMDFDGDGRPDPVEGIKATVLDNKVLIEPVISGSQAPAVAISSEYRGWYRLTGGEYANTDYCYRGGKVTFYIDTSDYTSNGYRVTGLTNTGESITGLYITKEGKLYGEAIDEEYIVTRWSGEVIGRKIVGTYDTEEGACYGEFEVTAVR